MPRKLIDSPKAAYHRDFASKIRKQRKLQGVCACGNNLKINRKTCNICVKRARYHFNKRIRKGICGRCGIKPLSSKTRCTDCLKYGVKTRLALKVETIAAYGSGCSCSGCSHNEIEFMTLEHSRNDGAEHKREIGCFGINLYRWLKKNGFPKNLGLVVMCMNCNFSRGKYGYCPHANKS